MLDELLNTPTPPPVTRRGKESYTFTQEYDPLDPKSATITATSTRQLQDDNAIRSFILDNGGLIPDGYRARLVEARHNTAAWTRDNPDDPATTRGTWWYRFAVEPAIDRHNLDDLLDIVKRHKPAKPAKPATTDETYHVLIGDLQLGKDADGDGTEGIVARFLHSLDQAVNKWRTYGATHPVHLAFLGDCIEGNQAQNGRNWWRSRLTVTEQTRLLRRLILHTIDRFTDNGAPAITLDVVNGNHDQVQRFQETRADDGHATEAAIAVSEAIATNPERYGNVRIYVPGVDEDHIVRTVGTTTLVMLHGHQFRNRHTGAFDWWSGQTFNNQAASAATILVHGHQHEFKIGSKEGRLVLTLPPFDSSTWWTHKTGDKSIRGAVVMLTRNGNPIDITVV